MAVLNRTLALLILLAIDVHAGGQKGVTLTELRQLPENERELTFNRQDEETKVELFFQANRRHPPYTGLNDAIAKEGKDFLVRLRSELDTRGGVPEVLSFMGIVFDLKNRGLLSSDDIKILRIRGICHLAKPSKYCPGLESQLLAP